jgi:hypothetical protein
MAKSNYPNKLDTSVEIPAVRDNIVEIGSDVINSLRSAIFQVERTLGINPQGAAGNSVAARINKALDGNGNIRTDALNRAGLLSGPIANEDVSKAAAINESKLRLNFPTQLLQDEISQTINQINLLEASIAELNTLLAAHTHPAATGRHKGLAITIEKILNTPSDIGVTSSDELTAQQAFQQLYNSHLNYSGANISETNRSHVAEQIFFDNENVSTTTDSDNVQEALEDSFAAAEGQIDIHQNLHHSNGILRSNLISSGVSSSRGVLLLAEEDISYVKSSTDANSIISNILFEDSPLVPDLSIEASDILEITVGTTVLTFQVHQVNLAPGDLNIESIDIYGHFSAASATGTTAKVYRNINRESEPVGLLLTAREYQSSGAISFSNADVVQVSNPNSANIVTKNIRPNEISLTNRFIKISIDGASAFQIDVYDSDIALAGESQSTDSIIKAFNAAFAENRFSVSAYRLDYDQKDHSEIVFVHSIPSTATNEYTIEFSSGSDDAIDSLGLSGVEDTTITSGPGTQYFIQGKAFAGLGTKVDSLNLTLLSGTSSVSSNVIDFEESGVRNGDILVISESPGDDGTYVILDVSSGSITVDRTQLTSNQWTSTSSVSTRFTIYKNSVSLNEMAFKVSPGGSASASVVDVFMDRTNRDIHYKERLTYGTEVYLGSESLISVVDFSGDVSKYTSASVGILSAAKTSLDPADLEVELSLDSGETFHLENIKSEYITLFSGKYNISLTVFVKDSDKIASKIVADSSGFSTSLYGYPGINEEENLLLGRVPYEAAVSRVSGSGQDFPRILGKLQKGSISTKDIGTDALFGLYQSPLLETRSNGVIRGLDITSVTDNGTTYTISFSSGVCYVRGKRFELEEVSNYVTDIETGAGPTVDKFYAAINQWGEIVFRAPDPAACDCPFSPYNYCILGAVENNGTTIDAIDLRLFIDNLDLRILNSITVSPQPGMGHFTDINKALKYAKRFAQAFPKAGIPTVHLKSGTHQIITAMSTTIGAYTPLAAADIQPAYDGGIWLNFPVNIVGEGPSTVLDLVRTFTDADLSLDSRDNASESEMSNWMYIAGSGLAASAPDGDSDVLISNQINIRDLKLNLSGIQIIDPLIESGGSKLNYSINIENVIFDQSGKAGFNQYNYGVLIQGIDTSAGSKVGNLNITNCEFLNSHIKTNTYNAVDHFNINISNNLFRGTGDGTVDGESHYAVFVSGTGHIFDFAGSASFNNIEFRANTMSDSTDGTSDPSPDASSAHLWGDRISRGLVIGGRLGIGTASPENTAHISGQVYIESTASDVTPADQESGALIVGTKSAQHIAMDGNEIMARNGNAMDELHLNHEGDNPVLIGASSANAGNSEIIRAKGLANFYDSTVSAETPAIINIRTSSKQSLYMRGSAGGGIGDIAINKDINAPESGSTTISFGEYDPGLASGSLYGTDFYECFRMDTHFGRFDIFQQSDSTFAGLRIHKANTHMAEGTPATNHNWWNLWNMPQYPATGPAVGVDVLAFQHYSSTYGSSEVKAFILNSSADTDGLDFTGQHRSTSDEDLYSDANVGLIVSSSGVYNNLDSSTKAEINEALPAVILSTIPWDKKVFGVISDSEDQNSENRIYSVGAFVSTFEKNDNRLIINSLGEGGIWVSNINGNLENGDYITTCEIPGYGMLQDDDLLHNYTVAKITCDCTFDLDSKTYNCLEFEHNGQTYRKAFVGCTYHCG